MGKNAKLILILVLALGLRLVNINQSFWLDEASQAQLSDLSLNTIWNGRNVDFQPPLFYVLAHFWLSFGRSESWLRLLPVGFGILTVAAIYYLTKQVSGEKPALISAFLLTVNPYHIYYSQEFRMYSLMVLLSILSVMLMLRKSKYLFIVNAIMLYTHYLSGLFLLFEAVYIFIARKDTKWFVGQLFLSGTAYIFWLPHLWAQLHSGLNIDNYLPGWRQVLGLSTIRAIPEILFKFVAGRINIFPKFIYYIYIAFVLAVTGFGLLIAKQDRLLLWAWLFLPILLSIIISPLIPQTQPFRLIFTLPALIIIFAQAVTKYPRLMMTLLIYIAIVGNVLYYTRPRLQREQWRQAIAFVRTKPGTVAVKFGSPFAPFSWYAPDLPVSGLINRYPATKENLHIDFTTKDVYLFDYLTGLTDPQYLVNVTLGEQGYVNVKTYNYEGVGLIYHYVKL